MNTKKEKFEWVKVEVLDEIGNPTGHFKLYRDFQWRDMVKDTTMKHLRYVEHCHFHYIENPKRELIH